MLLQIGMKYEDIASYFIDFVQVVSLTSADLNELNKRFWGKKSDQLLIYESLSQEMI